MATSPANWYRGLRLIPGIFLLIGLYLTSLYSYLLFHSLAEAFSIFVTGGIFMFAWNARRYLDNNYLLFIGIAYLFVAGLGLLHLLAYKGMGVFIGFGANLPTQLWIAQRYLQSLALLIAPLWIGRKLRVAYVVAALTLVFAILVSAIFVWRIFPVCYIEGVGLTPFKIASEYIISLIFLISIGLLWWKRQEFAPRVFSVLVGSIAVAITAELAFTLYVDVYGLVNMLGHMLNIISFYLLYKAIIETGLVSPYNILLRKLKNNEAVLLQYTRELHIRNEELDAFAHTVAHDLKSPISELLITAKVLEDDDLNPSRRLEMVQNIAGTAHQMNNIVNELMLLAEVRQVEVLQTPLEMASIVGSALKRLESLSRERRAKILLPEAWPDALGYSPWVEEVWVNYLSNALRYSGPAPCIELGAMLESGDRVRFWVQDDGPGILFEHQERLFKPFTQLSQVHTSGHGLGLSIVRRIVERLGGQVGVESQPGQGSRFFFFLPAAPIVQSGEDTGLGTRAE